MNSSTMLSRGKESNSVCDQLIEPGRFYFHNVLRETSSPPLSYIDDDGNIVYVDQQQFSVRPKKSFTTTDLLKYYQDAFEISLIHPDDVKQYTNALRYMAKRYGLDETLFTIDYYRDLIASENVAPPSVPFDIQRYFPYGKDTLENKKAREIAAGIVKKQESENGVNYYCQS